MAENLCKPDGLLSVCLSSEWSAQQACQFGRKAVNGFEHCYHYRPDSGHCDSLEAQQDAKGGCK